MNKKFEVCLYNMESKKYSNVKWFDIDNPVKAKDYYKEIKKMETETIIALISITE